MKLLVILIWVLIICYGNCQKPDVVSIGAIFTFDSVIGRSAKAAMELAVSDVNANPSILSGTELKLLMMDANCSVFMGSISAFQLIEKEVVAIIGPQSSTIAHMISQIADGLEVPQISYAATDPTLSSLQFPFFFRTTQSDCDQMMAMADLITFYGWKKVIAIFADDEYGRYGVYALDDELEKRMLKTYKMPLPIQFDISDITDVLKKSKLLGVRVYVVHVSPDPSLRIFNVARNLGMMTDNYVWFATDSFSATLDSFSPTYQTLLGALQGVVALRQHIPESSQKRDFVSRWRSMQQKGLSSTELNAYAFHAYDTVWTVAYSIDKYIKSYGNITFSFNRLSKETKIELGWLRVFDGGIRLHEILVQTNFTGVSGQVHFSPDRNIISRGYDIININQMAIQRVGYWSNSSGLSVFPPETFRGKQTSSSLLDQKLGNVTWPGGQARIPRGWVIGDTERPLRIAVPNRASFVSFVTEQHENHKIQGYCIDLFEAARELVPYNIPYRFELFGNGKSNPSYDELVKTVADDMFDAAVGDITIVPNRSKIVDFSQPYVATGLVIVAPINNLKSNAWVFLKPFSLELWGVTAAAFFMIAVVIWVLEHRVNDEFRGPPKRQLVNMLMFSFSTLFKTNQEMTVSALGRMVMVLWLFLLMVITSSYTASLTSILTVQQLSSPITGIDSLIASNWPIGFQVGSFAYTYLTDSLYIAPSRLISLGSPEEYEKALRQGPHNGGVAAVIDELPYVELFLSKQTDFGIVGQSFTKSGWGFAFQRDSPLALDMSTAILKLSETGKLRKIHEKWFCKLGCPGERGNNAEPNKLHLISFWGLYLLCAVVTLSALFVFLLKMVRLFVKHKYRQNDPSSLSSSRASSRSCSEIIYNFFDFIDEKEDSTKRKSMPSEIVRTSGELNSV